MSITTKAELKALSTAAKSETGSDSPKPRSARWKAARFKEISGVKVRILPGIGETIQLGALLPTTWGDYKGFIVYDDAFMGWDPEHLDRCALAVNEHVSRMERLAELPLSRRHDVSRLNDVWLTLFTACESFVYVEEDIGDAIPRRKAVRESMGTISRHASSILEELKQHADLFTPYSSHLTNDGSAKWSEPSIDALAIQDFFVDSSR